MPSAVILGGVPASPARSRGAPPPRALASRVALPGARLGSAGSCVLASSRALGRVALARATPAAPSRLVVSRLRRGVRRGRGELGPAAPSRVARRRPAAEFPPDAPRRGVDYSSIDASPVSKVLIRTISGLLVEEVGKDTDPRPWDVFDAVLTPVREVNDMKGTARDVTVRAKRVFAGILPALYIGWVPPIWKTPSESRPQWASNYAFVLVFTTLFPWLMGPMEGIDHVDVKVPEALRKAFKFLPESVKVPRGDQGGAVPLPGAIRVRVRVRQLVQSPEPGVARGRLRHGPAHPAQLRRPVVPVEVQRQAPAAVRGRRGDGAVLRQLPERIQGREGRVPASRAGSIGRRHRRRRGHVHGETLEAIARRASAAAVSDAAVAPMSAGGMATDGTAASEEGFVERVDEVKAGGKCWSVDESRECMGEVGGRSEEPRSGRGGEEGGEGEEDAESVERRKRSSPE